MIRNLLFAALDTVLIVGFSWLLQLMFGWNVWVCVAVSASLVTISHALLLHRLVNSVRKDDD